MHTQEQKRLRAKQLLVQQIELGIKPISKKNPVERPYTEREIQEKKDQIEILNARLNGEKRFSKNKKQQEVREEENWVIEIYKINFGYVKNSERRKLKGGSKKKLKKVKTMTLHQTVKNRPGLINQYKAGLMGISPKTHAFKMVQKTTN